MSPGRSPEVRAAEALARKGQIDAAVAAAFSAVRADDGSPHAHALLADLMLVGDFCDEAVRFATRAIELDADCAPAYLALGLAYDRRGGMWDQSVLVWHELAEVVPDLVTAHVQLGEALMAAGFADEAIASWRRALTIDPHEARAMYNLAVAALRQEGVPTALPGFRRAGELDPSQDDLFFHLAGVGSAPQTLRDPASVPDERDPLLVAACALARAEDYFGAQDLVSRALALDAEDAGALALAGYVFLKQESINECMAVSLRALAIDGGSAAALYDLGVAYSKRVGLARHAVRVFAALAGAAKGHPMPHVLLAESLMSLQRYDLASRSYRRAVSLDPSCVRARFGIAAALLTEGRWAEADWEIRRAAYYDTRRQGLFWRLYDAYASGGDA